jgi:hypothetical protein|tara:strand:- start:12556 stop:13071 length:516 start_codon:yes stop_codon:yes gene_type:complete
MSARYRPRQARASALWQCLHTALPDFLRHYAERHASTLGPLLPERQAALERFLRCGDLSQGFLRVRCEDCDHEYLVPYTCKQRGICPTCHQRRSVDLSATIATEICAPVPHRHWVFTIPQLLRPVFRREPRRLGLLARLTADCLTDYLRDRTGLPEGRPGIVLAFHTFGDR